MPTFRNIDLEEPSTVTAEVAAVSIDRNSSAELQELLTLADPDISTNLARVTSVVPESTMAGVGVRIISGPSTAADAVIRVNQGVGISTAGDGWRISSVSGRVAVGPHDTAFASSAGFHFEASSGALQVTPGSTVWQTQVSSVSGRVLVDQNSTVWAVQSAMTFVRPATATRNSLTQSSTSVTAQALNTGRLGWTCYNHPAQGSYLYLKWGTTASTTDFDVRIPPFSLYEMPQPVFTGRIDAIWDSTGTGYARTVELTA